MPSIIVCARNNGSYTANCLASLLISIGSLQLNGCEFILVDDASAPGEQIQAVFQQHRANASGHETKIIRARKHLHYSRAVSVGLHFATRDIVFFISNDMLVTPNFLQALLLVSSLSRSFGIVRGFSNYMDSHEHLQLGPPVPPKNFVEVDQFSRDIFGKNGTRHFEVGVLSADAVLIKRAVLETLGVFDPRYFGYLGDADYGMRAHLAGFKIACAAGAWLHHVGAGHLKFGAQVEAGYADRADLVNRNYQQFREKWRLAAATPKELGSLELFDHARTQAQAVRIREELPAEILADLEML